MYHLIDFITKQRVHPVNLIFTGENSPWEVCIDLTATKNKINLTEYKTQTPHLTKYLPFLPFARPSSLLKWQENPTPLVKSSYFGPRLGIELYFKIEGKNPTGSFKDRGSAIEMTLAKQHHAKKVVVASTGNMAASCACYAALAELPCQVFVPSGLPPAKLAQVQAFGAKITEVAGDYNDAAKQAKETAEKNHFYLAGDYAFRVEGQKIALFELLDQLHFHVPDQILIPMGCGTNIAAYYKGLHEYHALHLITRYPQLIGIQAKGANPIVRSVRHHAYTIKPQQNAHTLASAIAVGNPVDGLKALQAIYQTAGLALDVTDKMILKAHHLLAQHEGLFVESASAAVVAGLLKLSQHQQLKKKVVCILTGDGLKDANITHNSSEGVAPNCRW